MEKQMSNKEKFFISRIDYSEWGKISRKEVIKHLNTLERKIVIGYNNLTLLYYVQSLVDKYNEVVVSQENGISKERRLSVLPVGYNTLVVNEINKNVSYVAEIFFEKVSGEINIT